VLLTLAYVLVRRVLGLAVLIFRRDLAKDAELLVLLCVPKTSSTSSDQAVFIDQATDTRLFPDAVPLEIDRFG
jgi:hypothetical protein